VATRVHQRRAQTPSSKLKGHRLLIKPDEVKSKFNENVPEELKKVGFKVELTKEQDNEKKQLLVPELWLALVLLRGTPDDKNSPESGALV